jgi:hypothetical protein
LQINPADLCSPEAANFDKSRHCAASFAQCLYFNRVFHINDVPFSRIASIIQPSSSCQLLARSQLAFQTSKVENQPGIGMENHPSRVFIYLAFRAFIAYL